MSFFDETDEPPPTEVRTTTRTAPRPGRRRRPGGGGRRPPRDQQAIQVRRAVALGALLIIVLLIALGVHSCSVSSTQSALQNYTNNVSSLVAQSTQNGNNLFSALSQAGSAGSPTQVQHQVNVALNNARRILSHAQRISVPDQVRTGHRDLVMALRMRVDGISAIADEIQPALGTSAGTSEVNRIAAQMARFYASDVMYKDYAAPAIAEAVNGAGVRFSPLNGGQFVPDVQWLVPSYIARQLHVSSSGQGGKVAPGLHGHQLTSVSVNGASLQTGGAGNNVPASPPPTFTLDFTNGGDNDETNVRCKVTVSGTGISGTATVPQTYAGKSASCQVKLNSTPPTGTPETVVAEVEKVPGEKNVSNNSITYTITFQ